MVLVELPQYDVHSRSQRMAPRQPRNGLGIDCRPRSDACRCGRCARRGNRYAEADGDAILGTLPPASARFVRSIGAFALARLHSLMKSDEVGRRILAEKPAVRLSTVDFERLGQLSPDTFGHAYWRYMSENGCAADHC